MMDGNYEEDEEMEESIVTEVSKPIDYEKELNLPPVKGMDWIVVVQQRLKLKKRWA